MDLTITLSDAETLAATAEHAAVKDPKAVTIEGLLTAAFRHQVLTPMVERQRQYTVGRAVKRLEGLAPKLAQLTDEQQRTIEVTLTKAVDDALAGK